MRITCLQENLNKGLSVVSRFVANKPQLPILSNILICTQEGKLKLGATNLESGVSLLIGAKIEEEGKITIPAKTLTEFIGQLPADKVELITEENNLKINCQKFTATINGLSAEEYPPLPKAQGTKPLIFKTKDILLPISQVSFSAAQDESRPVLSGVRIFSGEKGLTLAATDGFRLSVVKIAVQGTPSLDMVLPARTLVEVVRILAEEKEEEFKLEVSSETGQVIFSLVNQEIFSRLLEGQFPNFEKIIPTSFTTRATVSREEFLSAIKTTSIFAREAANIIKFIIKNSEFRIEANAPQVGENSVEVEAKIEGEGGEIAFNARFLLDYLNVVPSGEISFEMTNSLSPGVFRVPGEENLLHIIMPVKVQE